MYQILDLLSKQELESFNYLKQRFYKELVNGFYVYAKKKEKDNDDNNVDIRPLPVEDKHLLLDLSKIEQLIDKFEQAVGKFHLNVEWWVY